MRTLIAFCTAACLPAASVAEPVRASYEVSWQGIEVATVETELSENDGGYRLAWRGRTSGFLGVVYPFVSEATSEGGRAEDGRQPRSHAGRSLRGGETKAWMVDFGVGGSAVRVDIPEDDRMDREPVPMGLQVGPDPLSLALLALDGAGPGTRMTGRAFDGRRAFELSSACADAVEVLPETGEALLCTVEGKLLAGASRRWRDRGQPPEERPPARIWLGRDVVTDGWWPVRMEASTRWGTVIVRLVGPASPAPAG
ncbi:MAG TPA: DUF3108 domain-containing protein [Geminicoccaceae bacterium]|nr:DUF3108 domain-containing protein [Geminicoccus sp.]HMU52480.1 DUF3108 domain-containing protein [Geminicoccaceae bacterium]